MSPLAAVPPSPTLDDAPSATLAGAASGVVSCVSVADLLLFRGRRPRDAVVRWLSDSDYTHVGVVVRVDGVPCCVEASGEGVGLTPLDALVSGYHGGLDHFACHGLDGAARERVQAYLMAQLGKPYDYVTGFGFMALLALGVRASVARQLARRGARGAVGDRWLCSHLVAEAFAAAGQPLLPRRVNRYVSPADLTRSPVLRHARRLKV